MFFQDAIEILSSFWKRKGCAILSPFDMCIGAATFHPEVVFKSLFTTPYKCAFVQQCRRPSDGRYGDNPNRFQSFHQFQVVIKPSPDNIKELTLQSFEALGFAIDEHDFSFIEDNWRGPTLGATGVGWELRCDGMEVLQFTYFQKMGGFNCFPIPVELAYGLGRILMKLQNVDSAYDIMWNEHIRYGDLYHEAEVQCSKYNFEEANVDFYKSKFYALLEEATRIIERGLFIPAYELCIEASHVFNILEARGSIGVEERELFIDKIRTSVSKCCKEYIKSCEATNEK